MFDLSWGEMMLIGAVALIVIGPKDLPRTLRAVGQGVGKIKRMASEFQGQFNQAMREAELDSVRKEVEGINRAAQAGMNPAKAARDELRRAVEGKPGDGKPVGSGPSLAKPAGAAPSLEKPAPAASAGADPGEPAAPAPPAAAPQPLPVATPAPADKEEAKP